jgi:ABC-2 type transport system ATP-binding protein
LEQPEGHEWIARLVEAFPGQIDSLTLGKPTLEDVFIDRTGHRFWTDQTPADAGR